MRRGGPGAEVELITTEKDPLLSKVVCGVALVEVVLVTVFWGVFLHREVTDYNVTTSAFDIVFLTWFKLAGTLWAFGKDRKQPGDVFFPVILLTTTLLVAKVVCFHWHGGAGESHTREVWADVVLGVVCAATLTEAGLARAAAGGIRKKIPSTRAIGMILKPYFVPRGGLNQLRAVVTWLCIIGAKACNVFVPLLMGDIVTDLTNYRSPYKNIALYCGIAITAKALKELQSMVYQKVKQTAFVEMADNVFAHVHNLSLEWNLRKKMGTVVRSMDRGTEAADLVVTYLFLYLVPTIAECIVTFIIFYVHYDQPNIAAVCILSFTLYLLLTYYFTGWRRKFRERYNQHDNDYHMKMTESLVNFETVKYFTAEHSERKSMIDSVKAYQKSGLYIQVTLSALNLSQQLIIWGCQAGAMVLAGKAVLDAYHGGNPDGFQTGDFVAVSSYVSQLFTPLTFLGTVYNTVIMSFVNMQHLADLLSEVPDVVDAPDAKPLALPYDSTVKGVDVEFRKVSFKYPAADAGQGLRQVSFSARAGQKVAIVGETGSGKTTISRLLFRFYDVNEGSILVNEQDLANVQQRSVRAQIGIVPQNTVLFNASIKYNVLYGNPDADDAALERVAKEAALDRVIEKLPNGWDTVVGERGLRLSGGEKQRVAIARCLLKDPPIIVLDEATSALDSNTEREINDCLQCLGKRTMLVIAHRLSTIQDADCILVMRDGMVVESGTHASLRAEGGVYDSMWKIQESAMAAAPGVGETEAEAGEGKKDA